MLETLRSIVSVLSYFVLPTLIVGFPLYGLIKGVRVYEVFVEGAKEGFEVAVTIIPYLIAILFAIGMFRASGAMDFLVEALDPVLTIIGVPAEVVPMGIVRPLTGSGSAGLVTFYVIAVYFGAVNIRNTRHAVPAGLFADAVGFLASVYVVQLLFG